MKKPFLLLSFLIAVLFSQAQKNIAVHFLYGSIPAKGFEGKEKKVFGGKKGGHVTIEADDKIIGFQPKGTCHIFGEGKHANGYFRAEDKTGRSRQRRIRPSVADASGSSLPPHSTGATCPTSTVAVPRTVLKALPVGLTLVANTPALWSQIR